VSEKLKEEERYELGKKANLKRRYREKGKEEAAAKRRRGE